MARSRAPCAGAVESAAQCREITDTGGCISLSAHELTGELILAVRDNGIGVAPELQDKVFELFMQDLGALASARGGLGLELTLVRSLVQLHGGSSSQ